MIESISYRATKRLPKIKQLDEAQIPQVIGINEILIKLSYLPSGPLNSETLLIIELNKKDTTFDIEKIINLIMSMDNVLNDNLLTLAKISLEAGDLEVANNFVKKLQKYLISVPSVWEKYNKDMLFSIKVGKYYQQLDLFLHARPIEP